MKRNRQWQDEQAQIVYDQLTQELKRCADLSEEKGSSWLSVLPLEEHDFTYTKESSGMHYACDMDGSQTAPLRPVE